MDQAFAASKAAYRITRARCKIGKSFQMKVYQVRRSSYRSEREAFPIIGPKMAIRGVAEMYRFVEHRIEHRLQMAGVGIDNLQHLSGRGLLLQRLALLVQ
jgi:hypothetical protein